MPITSVVDFNHSAVDLVPSIGFAFQAESYLSRPLVPGPWGIQFSANWTGRWPKTERWKAGLKLCIANSHWLWSHRGCGKGTSTARSSGEDHTPHSSSQHIHIYQVQYSQLAATKENLGTRWASQGLWHQSVISIHEAEDPGREASEPELRGSIHSELEGELFRLFPEHLWILSQEVSKFQTHRLFQIRSTHQHVEGLQDLIGLGVRLPVLGADEGQAHQSILTDVGVVDLGGESQSGRLKWILPGEINPQIEGLEAIGKLVWQQEHVPHKHISIVARQLAKVWRKLLQKILQLFRYSLAGGHLELERVGAWGTRRFLQDPAL